MIRHRIYETMYLDRDNLLEWMKAPTPEAKVDNYAWL